MQEFDEYHGEAVLEKSLPRLLKNDKEIQKLLANLGGSHGLGSHVPEDYSPMAQSQLAGDY